MIKPKENPCLRCGVDMTAREDFVGGGFCFICAPIYSSSSTRCHECGRCEAQTGSHCFECAGGIMCEELGLPELEAA